MQAIMIIHIEVLAFHAVSVDETRWKTFFMVAVSVDKWASMEQRCRRHTNQHHLVFGICIDGIERGRTLTGLGALKPRVIKI